jgi:hypothetical protein
MSSAQISALLRVAGVNHGLIDSPRLTDLGISASQASRLARVGVLEPTDWRGIRRVTGFSETPRQRQLGATWAAGPGSALSHRGAAWLWGLDSAPEPALEVSIPRGTARRPTGVRLHHSTDLTPSMVTTVDGIAVTEATRTLIDLAAVVDLDTLEIAFDSALRQGLTSVDRSRRLLERLARPGRPGLGNFRHLLDARRDVDAVTDSMFENRLIHVLRRGGLPEPDRQIRLDDPDGFIGRFDCGYRPALVVIEADSVRHHHDRTRFESDRRKRTRAEAIGWRVPTFTWQQVTRQPLWVADRTAAVLDATGWQWRDLAA